MTWPDRPSDPPVRHLDLPRGPAAITDEGTGPAVFAIHGLPGSRFDFRWLAPALPGVRFLRADLPGFGQTPAALAGPTFADQTAYLKAVLDVLGIDRVVLLAHSFGAGIAAHLAEDLGPRARGLAVLAPAGLVPHSMLRYQGVVGAVARAARTPWLGWAVGHLLVPPYRAVGFRRAGAVETRRTLSIVGAWDYASTCRAAAALGARKLPGLVALAEDDPIVEPPCMRAWAEALDVAPLAFPTGGHILQKTRASEIGGAVREWLDGLPPS